jgi:glycosyltransferase involved in cell wall biosynthesis
VSSLVSTPYGADQRQAPGASSVRLAGVQAADVATARVVRRFHATAEHVRTTMARRLQVDPRRIDVVPRGRSSDELGRRSPERRARVRSALGLGDEPVVLTVAREEHVKGIDLALDAIGAVREQRAVRLLVSGREGNATRSLREQVTNARLGDCVTFLGFRRDVPDLMAAADVVLLPSRREGFPGVLVEALALEAPVVATDLPGVREAMGDSGVLVADADGRALALAVESVLDQPDAAARMAQRSRRRFESRFTIERTADAMAGFFIRSLVAGPL